MVKGRPKTPLFPTDGERGFVFFGSGKVSGKDMGLGRRN